MMRHHREALAIVAIGAAILAAFICAARIEEPAPIPTPPIAPASVVIAAPPAAGAISRGADGCLWAQIRSGACTTCTARAPVIGRDSRQICERNEALPLFHPPTE